MPSNSLVVVVVVSTAAAAAAFDFADPRGIAPYGAAVRSSVLRTLLRANDIKPYTPPPPPPPPPSTKFAESSVNASSGTIGGKGR